MNDGLELLKIFTSKPLNIASLTEAYSRYRASDPEHITQKLAFYTSFYTNNLTSNRILEALINQFTDPADESAPETQHAILAILPQLLTDMQLVPAQQDTKVIDKILQHITKTNSNYLKLLEIVLPHYKDLHDISLHIPAELSPNLEQTFAYVPALYAAAIRKHDKPITSSKTLSVKVLERFLEAGYNILCPVEIDSSKYPSQQQKKEDSPFYKTFLITTSAGTRIMYNPVSTPNTNSLGTGVNGTQFPYPACDNLLALSIRTHNINILHPTNLSYHITKFLLYQLNNTGDPESAYKILSDCPNPFILALITLPLQLNQVSNETAQHNYILVQNFLAKVYDILITDPNLFPLLITPERQISFRDLLIHLRLVPFLLRATNYYRNPEINNNPEGVKPESFFPGTYDCATVIQYFIDFTENDNPKPPAEQKMNGISFSD